VSKQNQAKQRLPKKPKPQKNSKKNIAKKKIHLGSIGKPHGVVGAFFIHGRADQIPDVENVFIGSDEDKVQSAKVMRSFISAKKPVLQIDLISSREELTKYQRQNIFAELAELDFDDENEFFLNDVVGKTIEFKGQNGTEIFGTISAIYETPSNLNISIGHQNREIDLPFNQEYFDMNFSPEAKSILLLFNPKDLEEFWIKKS